jgi:hypothetical protein
MFSPAFEGTLIRIKSLLKFVFIPSWQRAYLLAKYVRHGLTAREAMVRVGVIVA